MMRQMRASARWVMGILVVSFVGWMVFEVGMDVSGRGGPTLNEAVGRVNGVKIDYQTYYTAVRNAQEQTRQEQGTAPTTLEGLQQLEDAVFESMVQDILLASELRERGITVTDQEIVDAARNSPPPEVMQVPEFQTDGQFDPEKYQRFLAANPDPTFMIALESRYRDEIPRIKLYEQLTTGVHLSKARLWWFYRDRNDTATARVMVVNPATQIPDTAVEMSDEEIRRYYREHRSDFEKPDRAWLSYLSISRIPHASDSAAALERAQAIRQEIQEGADFAEVAARESADSASRENGGDLGEVERGRFVPEFEEAALALRPGEVSDPVLSPFGYHIIELHSKDRDGFHASHILVPVELAGDHLVTVEARADTLDLFGAELADPTEFDDVAERLNLEIKSLPPVYEGERLSIGNSFVPDGGVWAFGALEGESSPVIEEEDAYYLFRLDSLEQGGVPPLQEVRDEVVQALRLEKKKQLARDLVDEIAGEIESGTDLTTVAERRNLVATTVGPMTRRNPTFQLGGAPKVVGHIFGLKPGEAAGPIESNDRFYFVELISRSMADSSAFEAELGQLRQQLLQAARQEQVQLVLSSLRESADITDRRREVERQQREFANQTADGIPGLPATF